MDFAELRKNHSGRSARSLRIVADGALQRRAAVVHRQWRRRRRNPGTAIDHCRRSASQWKRPWSLQWEWAWQWPFEGEWKWPCEWQWEWPFAVDCQWPVEPAFGATDADGAPGDGGAEAAGVDAAASASS